MGPMGDVIWRHLGVCGYAAVWHQMQDHIEQRLLHEGRDELWLLEHPPIYTYGKKTPTELLPITEDIPCVETDRGGQITYHGPGQWIVYCLLALPMRSLRHLIYALEDGVIRVLADYGISGVRRENAPGVYIEHYKIASVGLKVRRGYTYHGLSFNVNMDLSPFHRIHPCGLRDIRAIDLSHFSPGVSMGAVQASLMRHLESALYDIG